MYRKLQDSKLGLTIHFMFLRVGLGLLFYRCLYRNKRPTDSQDATLLLDGIIPMQCIHAVK